MGGGIDPFGLVGPWIGYQILKIKKNGTQFQLSMTHTSYNSNNFFSY